MRYATLLFYATASFFLGVIAVATGGAVVLQSIFSPGTAVVGGDHEPWQTIIDALAIALPLVFLALAGFSIFVQPTDAPATASDIRTLISELDRSENRKP
jgi:ABC-type dipeptide/oligopeptide/nickel transport system permease component